MSQPGLFLELAQLVVDRGHQIESAESRADGTVSFTCREQQNPSLLPYQQQHVLPQPSAQPAGHRAPRALLPRAPQPHPQLFQFQQSFQQPFQHAAPAPRAYNYGYYPDTIPGHYHDGPPARRRVAVTRHGSNSEDPSTSVTVTARPQQAPARSAPPRLRHTPAAVTAPPPAVTTSTAPATATGGPALSEWEEELTAKLPEHTQVVASLKDNLAQLLLNPEIKDSNTWQEHNVRNMLALLQKSELAEPGARTCARWGTGQAVVDHLQANPATRQVLFFRDAETKDITAGRTINSELRQKLQHCPDLELSVQVPERDHDTSDSFARLPARDILQLFQDTSTSCMPRNMLSFVMHDTSSVRPSFITQLGPDLSAQIRGKCPKKATNAIAKDPPLWGTIGQSTATAGAISLPHMDRDGMDTFLICVQGRQVFIFADEYTPEQFEAYCYGSSDDAGIKWRVCILSPGEGVFMPAGTPHAVARLPGGEHSMTFGGHILRASQISRFAHLCQLQMDSPNVTNEDQTATSIPYLIEVGKIVKAAELSGDQSFPDNFGGIEEVTCFWATLRVMLTHRFRKPQANIEKAIDERLCADNIVKIRNVFTFKPASLVEQVIQPTKKRTHTARPKLTTNKTRSSRKRPRSTASEPTTNKTRSSRKRPRSTGSEPTTNET